MKYTIEDLQLEYFGYGYPEGCIVYLYNTNDYVEGVEEVVNYAYGDNIDEETGEMDWAEYDPSCIYDTIIGDICDELSFNDIVSKIEGEEDDKSKFIKFLNNILEGGYGLVFIDGINKTIRQIESSEDIEEIVKKNDKNKLGIFVRQYDHSYDY